MRDARSLFRSSRTEALLEAFPIAPRV